MRRVIFKKLITLEEALNLLEKYLPPKPLITEVNLLDSLNKVLAESIKAPMSNPPFIRSLVDGYAVNYLDCLNASEDSPVTLKIIGRVRVGEKPQVALGRNEAAEVDTGAALPEGANAVVPIEFTKITGNEVQIFKSVSFGENVAWPGTDVYENELIAKKGELVTPELIGVLASLGISKVKVYKAPKICVISTGNELVEPGKKLIIGKVYDVNTYALTAKIQALGFEAISMGIVKDSYDDLINIISKAVEICDVTVLSGGSSAGPEDLSYRVLKHMGELIVHGIKLKPGKPTAIAIVKGKPVFSLPGNPVSALVNFDLLVLPYVFKLAGKSEKLQKTRIKAFIGTPIKGEKGRRTYVPVKIFRGENGFYIFSKRFESYMISKFYMSDGYVVIPENRYTPLNIDEEVNVVVTNPNFNAYDLAYFGEEIPEISEVSESLGIVTKGYVCNYNVVMYALRKKIPDLAITPSIKRKPPNLDPNYATKEINLKIVLIGRKERSSVIPKFPPDTLLGEFNDYLRNIVENYHQIPVSSPSHALSLFKSGYINITPLPEYVALRHNLKILSFLGQKKIHMIYRGNIAEKVISELLKIILK